MKQAGETVYPHKFHVSISLRDFIEKYSHLKNEEVNTDVVSVAGKAGLLTISISKLLSSF
jgi:lysyl-tRNA synthetase, class II